MDALEYAAAIYDREESYWDIFGNAPIGRLSLTFMNDTAELIRTALNGQLYHAADVHDTGECLCSDESKKIDELMRKLARGAQQLDL